ncbi:hypothetical protein ETF27_02480 [Prevotella brunnea]|uniref:Uncharacterized protein n=1 Tax=Prevotella brunnea TaxID=2508867 RepID=A0A5C8GLB1_9BACT|nr:hypothetical protein [Prevotella brunnea]TXJ62942.1 hypothetical protein ETF27_02480 [Prevotella brunnea]
MRYTGDALTLHRKNVQYGVHRHGAGSKMAEPWSGHGRQSIISVTAVAYLSCTMLCTPSST